MTRRGLSSIMAMLAAFGGMAGNQFRRLQGFSKHSTTTHGRKPRKRLRMSRGAGSINCKADVQQLVNTRDYAAARNMVLDHERQCGEVLFPGAWWRDINALEV